MSAVVESDTRVANPFGEVVAQPTNAAALAMSHREVAEIQTMVMVAKKFPRDPIISMDRILNACTRPSLAEEATYEYARGGSQVTGASIRLAEVMAMNWGNMMTGVKEVSRINGVSECVAYAFDVETLFRDEKTFQVRHWRDTRSGGYQITEERDIYELIANMGARRKRACILAVIPGDVREAALEQCAKTLTAKVEITPDSIKKMLESFAAFSVTKEMIETKIQRRVDTILPAQVLQLRRIHNSLRDGMATVGDFFQAPDPVAGSAAATSQAEAIKEKIKSKQQGKPAEKAAAKQGESDYVPHFATDTALAELKKATTIEALEKAWVDINVDYDSSKRQLHPDIQDCYTLCKQSLLGVK